jgi:hypothetical protein
MSRYGRAVLMVGAIAPGAVRAILYCFRRLDYGQSLFGGVWWCRWRNVFSPSCLGFVMAAGDGRDLAVVPRRSSSQQQRPVHLHSSAPHTAYSTLPLLRHQLPRTPYRLTPHTRPPSLNLTPDPVAPRHHTIQHVGQDAAGTTAWRLRLQICPVQAGIARCAIAICIFT